jgi:drug/metabolite transporter (DMT)-like permease
VTSKQQGQLAGIASALLFGCSAPLISTLTQAGSALSIAGLLYGGATVMLLILRALYRDRAETPISRDDVPPLVLLTLLGGVVGPLALVLGLGRLSAASGSLLLNLEAVFTLVIAVLMGREHLGRNGLLSAGLTIAGAVFLSEGSLAGGTWQGAALIALATLAWGIDNNISQRLSLRDPLQIASIKATGAALPMIGLAALMGERFPSPQVITALLLIGAIGYGLSIWLDLLALRALGAAREAVIFSSAPFVGALFAVVVLQEPITPMVLVASVLMLSGVALLLREDHNHLHRHAPIRHAHRHRHDPSSADPHHDHHHSPGQLKDGSTDRAFWHAHDHDHEPVEHQHSHVSDAHHRHEH